MNGLINKPTKKEEEENLFHPLNTAYEDGHFAFELPFVSKSLICLHLHYTFYSIKLDVHSSLVFFPYLFLYFSSSALLLLSF